MDLSKEVIFIGLSGLTHHYGGLSPDNIASDKNRGSESSPRQAALQVIALARYLISIGINVAILPPQLRPNLAVIEQHGFTIENAPISVLEKASSSSFMWAANVGAVTPVFDSSDKKLHITVANLHTNEHRRIEAEATYHVLAQIFKDVANAVVHKSLDAKKGFLDEGAANHLRLSPSHSDAGLNIFVYGKRQNFEASNEIAKNHNIPENQTLFLEQNPEVIELGVFHNDVIALSNENLLIVHERAYKHGLVDIKKIGESYNILYPHNKLQIIIIKDAQLSVEEAVGSYFFNSQLVTKPDGKMVVIAPQELKNLYAGKAAKLIESLSGKAIDEVVYLDLRQSMRNGGGPACLRLRIVMDCQQFEAFKQNSGVIADEKMLVALEKIIVTYYPENLASEGLRSPELYKNSLKSMAEIGCLMGLSLG